MSRGEVEVCSRRVHHFLYQDAPVRVHYHTYPLTTHCSIHVQCRTFTDCSYYKKLHEYERVIYELIA